MNSSLSDKLKNPIVLATLMALLHLIVKFIALPNLTVQGDEAFSLFYAQQSFSELMARLYSDSNPPFFYILLFAWVKLFGLGPEISKALPIIFSAVTAFYLFRLGNLLGGIRLAVYCSILFFLSDLHFNFSHEIRAYSLVSALTCVSFFHFISFLKSSQKRHLWFVGVSVLLLAYSHYIALFVPIIQVMALLIYRSEVDWKSLIKTYVIAALFFIPQAFYMLKNTPDETFWLQKPTVTELWYVVKNVSGHFNWIWFFIITCAIGFTSLSASMKQRLFKADFDHKLFEVLILWFIFPILADFLLAQYIPIFRSRYLLFTSFGVILASGYVLFHLKWNPVFPALLIAFLTYKMAMSVSFKDRGAERWKKTSELVHNIQGENDLILICAPYKSRDFMYYYDRSLFEDYLNFDPNLRSRNIHPLASVDYYNDHLTDEKFDKIILILSHATLVDPDSNIHKSILLNDYKVCDQIGTAQTIQTIIYKPVNEFCSDLAFEDSERKEMDCFSWEERHLINRLDKRRITEFELQTDGNSLCDYRKSVSIPNNDSLSGYELKPPSQYSPTISMNATSVGKMKIRANIQGPVNSSANIIFNVIMGEKEMYREVFYLKDLINSNSPTSFEFSTYNPITNVSDAEVKIYIWNPDNEPIYLSRFNAELWEPLIQ